MTKVFFQWAGWRLATGSEPIARLVVHAGVRAFVWFAAWHLADVLGASLVVAVMVLVTLVAVLSSQLGRGGGLRHSRHRRPPPRSGLSRDESPPPLHERTPGRGSSPDDAESTDPGKETAPCR